jgi:hypothetical protein
VGKWLRPEPGGSGGGCLGLAIAGFIVACVVLAALYSYVSSHMH